MPQHRSTRHPTHRLLVLLCATIALATSCGSDDTVTNESPTTTAPASTTAAAVTSASEPAELETAEDAEGDAPIEIRVDLVELDWRAIALDRTVERATIVDRALTIDVDGFDRLELTDDESWDTVLDWDRPYRLFTNGNDWVMLTVDAGSAIDPTVDASDTRYQRLALLVSGDAGASWDPIDIEAVTDESEFATPFLVPLSVVMLGDHILFSWAERWDVDWAAAARAAGVAEAGETVLPIQPDGSDNVLVIGPGTTRTASIAHTDVDLGPVAFESTLGFAPPKVRLGRSSNGEPASVQEPPSPNIGPVEIYDRRFALDLNPQLYLSDDGLEWEQTGFAGIHASSAANGWWVGDKFDIDTYSATVQQSFDGGATWQPVAAPEGLDLLAQGINVQSSGAATAWTEEPIGGQGDPPDITIEQNGFVYTMKDLALLSVSTSDGTVIVEEHSVSQGFSPEGLALNADGTMVLFDPATGEILDRGPSSEIFFSQVAVEATAGRSFVGWSSDGAAWFYDDIDFSPGLILNAGEYLVSSPGPFDSATKPVRIARIPR